MAANVLLSFKRANIMVKSNNGFEIAEEDLKMRGFGDFFGIRQHGLPELKIANLYEDLEVFEEAKKAASGFNLDEYIEILHKVKKLFIEGL